MKPLRTLIVEDSEMDERLLLRQLAKAGYDVQSARVQTAADLETTLAESDWDIVLSDYVMPGFSGLDALTVLKQSGRDIPLIIISGTIGEKTAVEAMRLGVHDYLMKDNLTRLAPAIERELENAARRRAQKQAEESLRRSEKNLADAQRIAHLGSWEVELSNLRRVNNNKVHWSDEVYRIFGYEPGAVQVSINNYFDSIHPDDRKYCRRAFVEAVLDRKDLNIEFRVVLPNGSEKILHGQAEVIYDEQSNQPLKFIGTVQDITERKGAEETLREREEWLRAILDGSRDGIVIEDGSEISYINKSYGEMLGYDTAEELVGKQISDLLPADEASRMSEYGERRRRGEEAPTVYEFKGKHKDGNLIELEGAVSTSVIGGRKFIMTAIRQITERKQIENNLRQSEEKYRLLIENAKDIIYTLDLSGRFTSLNRAGEQITGYPREKGLPVSLADVVSPNDLERVRERIAKNLSGSQQPNLELEIIGKSGNKVLLDISSRIIYQDGAAVGIQGIGRDITERKRAEVALRESEIRMRTILETEPECVKLLGFRGEVLEMNPAGLAMIEADSLEQILGSEAVNIVAPEHRRAFVKTTKNVLAGSSEILEFEIIGLKGTRRWVETHAVPMRNQAGEITSLLAVTRNITDRKRIEEEKALLTAQIEHQHERLDNIIDNISGVVWETWSEPDAAAQKIDFISDYVETMLDYTIEEWLDTPNFWLSIVHPDDRKRMAQVAAENFAKSQSFTAEFRWLAKDGRTVWVETRSSVICDKEGRAIGYRGVNIDITERKRLEEDRIKLTAELDIEKARLQHIFDNSPSFIVSMRGPEFVFEMANPAYYQLVGNRNLIGIPASEALPEIMTQGLSEIIRQVYITGEPFAGDEVPVKLQPQNGSEPEQHYINFVYMPLREADDSISGIISYGVDVTEQVLSRFKIQESEERYRIVAETANDVIITIDEHSSILFVNSAIEKTLGYKPEELTGKNLSIIVPERLRAAHVFGMNHYMQTGRKSIPWSGLEIHALHRDGSEKQIEISFSEYNENNKRFFTAVIRDITERKQAQQIILESEEKYRSIVETANEGIWLTDLETRTTYVNRQMAEMLGYTVEEMLGRPFFDFLFDEDLPDAKHIYEQRKFGSPETGEFRLRRKDGSEIITYYNTTQRRNQDGEIIGFLSMRSDVTERKKAEAYVNFQAHLLDVVEQSVIATDVNGIVTYWNRFAEKLYGWTSAEAVGRTAGELTAPEISLEQAEQVMKRLNEGNSWAGEVIVRNKAGVHFPVYISTSPVNDDAGKLVGKVGVSFDITKSKKAERELQNAEAKYRSLVESTPAIVYLNKPHPPYSTVYVSPNIKIFGYSPEEWYAGQGMWISMLCEEDRERVIREFEFAVRHDLETDLEYRIAARDGKIYWWKDKGRFIRDEEGNKIGWQGVILDVTKTKELEEQLRQSQKLESVGRMAGGIAHDFNNMLTAINGYSELTLRQLGAGNPLRQNIEEIKKAGERSAQLTHQLLAFSRQQVLKPVVLNLSVIITDTIKLIERLIGEDVKLVIALNPKTGRVNVDPGQLSQIIMNLAVNARDAMPNGGRLTIETANVFIKPQDARQKEGILSGAYVMLAVCDTGQGIDDKIQQQIFEPFFTTKELGKGTGLGLATVYGIVKQSGGNIEFESQVGVGSTFRIYLPRVAEQSEAVEITDTSAQFLAGTETILLVEDEEMVRHLSKAMLETCGYTVIEARDGLEALKIFDAGDCQPDLLMTDVVMPQMGGRELAEKLKERMPDIKILFTSGYTDDAVVRHGIIETSSNFIPKPFTFDALNHQVRKLLDAEDFKVNQ